MTAKGRIAFVANTSWSIYKFRLYLIERLLHEGFAVCVLAPRDAYTGKFEQLPGLSYIELVHFHAKSISPVQDYRLYRELYRHYRSIKPAIIFHYTVKANLYGTRAAARAGIPSVSVITGLGYTFSGPSRVKEWTPPGSSPPPMNHSLRKNKRSPSCSSVASSAIRVSMNSYRPPSYYKNRG